MAIELTGTITSIGAVAARMLDNTGDLYVQLRIADALNDGNQNSGVFGVRVASADAEGLAVGQLVNVTVALGPS